MRAKLNGGGTGRIEAQASAAEAMVERAAPEPRLRRYLGAGWAFTRHLLEMLLAMAAGMVLLGVAVGITGEPPAYLENALVEYAVMGAFMSAPMVGWMRFRGHAWADGLEMTAAMLVPMFALVIPVELGLAVLSEHSLMLFAHVAMIGGMALLMLYRFDRYVHAHHHTDHAATKEAE